MTNFKLHICELNILKLKSFLVSGNPMMNNFILIIMKVCFHDPGLEVSKKNFKIQILFLISLE